jgi:hypothetical protein
MKGAIDANTTSFGSGRCNVTHKPHDCDERASKEWEVRKCPKLSRPSFGADAKMNTFGLAPFKHRYLEPHRANDDL